MSSPLDPVIQSRLAALGRRWRWMVLARGTGGALATLLGGLIFAAFLDWFFLLPDGFRWALTGVVYAGTLAVFWRVAGRFLLHAPDPRDLARLAERADPALREQLVSAVELAGDDQRWDSPVFRQLLQEAVARRVQELNTARVLPRRLALRWVAAGGAAAGLCAGLWLVPGLEFGRMFARAVAPSANIERVSRTRITFLSPAQDGAFAPRGDALPVVVQVSGGSAATATLDVFRPGKPVERVAMIASAPGQFTGALMADEPRLEYRVRAGDGVSRRFALATRSRPHITQFEKLYQFPAYTRLTPRRQLDESGDLAALEGTQVELRLHVDQPLRSGGLQIQTPAGGSQVALQSMASNVMVARFPLSVSGSYRVKLVAAETGFENALSPQYEIKPVPDTVPRVELLEPGRDLLVPADEQLRLVGRVEDDVGLAALQQHTRVNGGPWTETVLALPAGLQVTVTQRWDLAPLNARPGDQVTTKLVALDLKGNRSETPPAKLTIASAGIDLRRVQAVDARRRLQGAMAELAKGLRDLERAGNEANTRSGKGELKAGQARLGLVPQMEEVERLAEAALGRIKTTVPRLRPGREASDMVAAGVAVAHLRHEALSALRAQLNTFDLSATNAPLPARDWQALMNPLRRAVSAATAVETALGNWLAAEQGDVAVESVAYLVAEQKRLATRAAALAPDGTAGWADLKRRVDSALRESRSIEEQLQSWSSRLPASLAARLKRAAASLGTARGQLERSLAGLKNDREVARGLPVFQRSLEGILADLSQGRQEAARTAEKARDSLRGATGTWLETAGTVTAALSPAVGGSTKKAPAPDLDDVARQWAGLVEQSKGLVGLEEVRPDVDSQFVADLGLAAEALSALRSAYASPGLMNSAAQPMDELTRVLRVLAASRSLGETAAHVHDLASQERWEAGSPLAATARPRDWQWLKQRWTAWGRESSGAGFDVVAENRLKEILATPQVADVSREMDARAARRSPPLSKAEALEQIAAMLDDVVRSVAAQAATARASVARIAPKLSERLEGLARKAEAIEQQTAGHQAVSEQMDIPANQTKAAELLERQEQLAAQIEELRAALRREANAQDMLTADGRERARDADDADALLKEPPHKAADRLRDAVAAEAKTDMANSLNAAQAEQKKTTEALNQLARHFKNAEMNQAALTRSQLRAAEEQLGMKSMFDQRYSAAAALAEMSKLSPEQQVAKLEEALKDNKPMQEELSSIMRNALQSAGSSLSEAARDEAAVAERLRSAGQREERQRAEAAAQARKLQEEARSVAQKDVPGAMQTAMNAQAAADDSFLEGAKALKNAADVSLPKSEAAAELSAPLEKMAASLKDAAASLREAANTTGAAARRDPGDSVAQAAKRQADRVASQAEAMARQAADLQKALSPSPDSGNKAVADAGARQDEIGKTVNGAAEELQRATRHETRLSPMKAFEMMSLSANVEMLAKGTLPQKQKELMTAPTPQAAEPAARSAQKSIEESASAVEAALGTGKPGQGQPGEGKQSPENAAAQQEGKMMARALDQLDSAMNQSKKPSASDSGQPNNQGQQSPSQAAQQAMRNLAQAQQEAARNSRQQQQQQPSQDTEGAGAEGFYQARAEASGALPANAARADGIWGKLPPQLARELMEGQRDAGGGEYRSMIDTYFKVIADRARGNAP